ncbi:MAG: oxidoreductase [Myxococcota bacterium]|nr:oxidoreductase [Myxococcota bacterium]
MSRTYPLPGGTWLLGDRPVTRFGYGAMQLAGPGVIGAPENIDGALEVLRAVVEHGITHIDTSDAYGPRFTNTLIREALSPYPSSLCIATKVGAERDANGGWPTARGPEQLRRQVEENLESLGVDTLDVVNLRMGDASGPKEEPLAAAFETHVDLKQQGVIRHLGLSNVTRKQVSEAVSIAPIVCVQNMYNLAFRHDDALIDELARQQIAYVPFFPLGGFTPLQSEAIARVATRHNTNTIAVALAWLLQRSPNILLIAGTSSARHLRQNLEGAHLELTSEDLHELGE